MPYIPIEKKLPDCDTEFKGSDCFAQLEHWLKSEKARRAREIVTVTGLYYFAKGEQSTLKVWLYKPADQNRHAS
jgi:hypothetical protein